MSKNTERSAVATPQNNSIRKKRPTQEDKVLEYLRSRGSLTTMEAVRELHIMNPQQRIKKLRDAGYNIVTEWEVAPSGARYGVYRLQEDINDNKIGA